MVIENRDKYYEQVAWRLFNILYSSGLNYDVHLVSVIGFFIALHKDNRLNPDDYNDLVTTRIVLDSYTIIRLSDVCDPLPMRESTISISHIIRNTDSRYCVQLFESVIKMAMTNGGRSIGEFSQPSELTHLVNSLLNENHVSRVYNPFAGIGSYQLDNKAVSYYSQEINRNTWIVGKIRLFLSGVQSEYRNEDSLTNWHGDKNVFDAIISTPPFGVTLTNDQKSALYGDMGFNHSDIGAMFIDKAIHNVSHGGLVIGIVPTGFLFRTGSTKNFRRFLVDNKYIETVITLPHGTFKPYAGVSTAIIVLSKKENLFIKLVDAKSLYSQAKRTNKLDVDKIFSVINSADEKYFRIVSNKEIEANDYNFDPTRYFIEEEIIPDGYKTIKLSDVSSIIPSRRHWSTTGRIVNISDLSNNSLDCIKKIEDIAEGEIKPNQFRLIEEPVLLLSMVRTLKPTYIHSSPSTPIYVSQNILALRVDPSIINIPYLAFELARKSDSLQRGAIIPRFNRRDIMDICINIPALPTLEDVLLKEKLEIEKAQYANKEAMVRELGLSAVIDAQKQELFTLIGHRKHRINPYFSGMQDNLKMLKDELNEVGSVSLDHKISQNYTVADLLDNFEKQISDVKELFKNLTSQFEINEKSSFNFVEFINSYNYVSKNPNLYLDIIVRSDGSIEESNREMFSSVNNITELIDIVIENAERHAFPGRDRGCIEIGYGEDGNGIYIQVLNDGVPLDDNFNEELSFSEGYKYGSTGNTGKGLFRAKQICLGIGASINWVNDDTSLFSTGILISIKDV